MYFYCFEESVIGLLCSAFFINIHRVSAPETIMNKTEHACLPLK